MKGSNLHFYAGYTFQHPLIINCISCCSFFRLIFFRRQFPARFRIGHSAVQHYHFGISICTN